MIPALLVAIAIFISFLAIFINQWVTLMPWLGISFQYHKRRAQVVVAFVALTLAGGAYLLWPSVNQLFSLLVVIALTPLSGFLYASKTLVPLDNPTYLYSS